MKTKRVDFINEGLERHAFGVTDSKGRAVGCTVAYSVQVFEQIPEDTRSWSTAAPGTYYAWMGTATRAGEAFGASQVWNLCATEAERFEAVQKYLKGAKARASKHLKVQ